MQCAEIRYPLALYLSQRHRGLNVDKDLPKDKTSQIGFAIGLPAQPGQAIVTARQAGGVTDLDLPISPRTNPPNVALRNLAKALNIALKVDFIESELDQIYKAARVHRGQVQVLHMDYIGLGDGVFASVGKTIRSFRLTFQGPDAGSPEGQEWIKSHGTAPARGLFSLIGRKLDMLQEFEDKVPLYVEQTLDRLESMRIIKEWNRNEWKIETAVIGLDVIITPLLQDESE